MKSDEVKDNNGKKHEKLLLHSCCAPCFSGSIERLLPDYEVTAFFSNDNLPPEEYSKRLNEQSRFINEFVPCVKLIADSYNENAFYDAVKGFENEPERGKRCEKCFYLRLYKTALSAKEMGHDCFATTLTLSPLKNAALINEIGGVISESVGIKYLPTDFKKKNGFLRSQELSKEYNLYRQNFCGCVFSMKRTVTE